MPKFRFDAVAEDGRRARGVLEAEGVTEATNLLLAQGFQPRRLKERKAFGQFEIIARKAKAVEVMQFSRQMAAFIRTGVPILDAIEVMREEMKDKVLSRVLADVAVRLRRGDSFADAVAEHAKAFPPFYVSILRSAELTGQLDLVLEQLSEYMERDLEAKRNIRGALVYPALVLAMSVVAVAVMTVFVLPRFQEFFASFDAELPFMTRLLIDVAGITSSYGLLGVWGFVLVVVGAAMGVRTERGRWLKDRLFLRLPIIGTVVRYAVVERFCRILGSMARAGVPVPDAMDIAGDGAHNLVFKRGLIVARQQMMEGQGLARPISQTGLFPAAVTQMLRAGEDTGTLDEQLDSMARHYERELGHKIKKLTDLFEPAIVIVVGAVVGFVAVALVSALYGIYNQVDIG